MIQQPGQLGKWKSTKSLSKTVAGTMRKISDRRLQDRADRMADCGDAVQYSVCPQCGRAHLARVRLCRDRLCPICSWRLARKRLGETRAAMALATQDQADLGCAMLTLTVRNCATGALKETVDGMLRGWDRLMKRTDVRRLVRGYVRSIELKRGDDGESWHPHLHALLIMPQAAMRKGCPERIEQERWVDMWGQSMMLSYVPIVDIRRAYYIRGGRKRWDDILASVTEACKYAVKGSDLARLDAMELDQVAMAIHGTRLIAYGGIVRQARALLRHRQADEPEEIEGEGRPESCPDCGCPDCALVTYAWQGCDYQEVQRLFLPYWTRDRGRRRKQEFEAVPI